MSDRERKIVSLKALLFSVLLGAFCYELHWTRQNNAALYEFAIRSPTPLAPMPCSEQRGIAGTDYVVASARRYTDARDVEACWYPISRIRQLFSQYASDGDTVIRRDRYRDMRIRPREFPYRQPALALIFAAMFASLMSAVFGLAAMLGSRKPPELEFEPEPLTEIDAVKLANDLAALRKRLGTGHDHPKV
jgi:hypothetical protein